MLCGFKLGLILFFKLLDLRLLKVRIFFKLIEMYLLNIYFKE